MMKTQILICHKPNCSLIRKGEFFSLCELDIPDCYCGCVIDSEGKKIEPRYRIIKIKREEVDESAIKGRLDQENYILAATESPRFSIPFIESFGKKQTVRLIPYGHEEFERLREKGKNLTISLAQTIR